MTGVRETLGVALAAAALVCALLAAPAFADAKAAGGKVQYVDCDQVQSVVGFQYNAASSADVNQEIHINQDQELACLSGDNDDDNNKDDNNKNKDDGTASADAIVPDDVLSDTIVKGTLPFTGGLSLPALAAYALVVTGIFSLARLMGPRR